MTLDDDQIEALLSGRPTSGPGVSAIAGTLTALRERSADLPLPLPDSRLEALFTAGELPAVDNVVRMQVRVERRARVALAASVAVLSLMVAGSADALPRPLQQIFDRLDPTPAPPLSSPLPAPPARRSADAVDPGDRTGMRIVLTQPVADPSSTAGSQVLAGSTPPIALDPTPADDHHGQGTDHGTPSDHDDETDTSTDTSDPDSSEDPDSDHHGNGDGATPPPDDPSDPPDDSEEAAESDHGSGEPGSGEPGDDSTESAGGDLSESG